MTAERVPVQLLEAGDVIRIRHRHDYRGGECLSRWEIDAVVTESPAPVGGRLAVKWAGDARLTGGRPAISGISVFGPGEWAAAADTDWRQIAALYSELLRFDPSPVIEANRAVAVAYAEGPAAGLAILDTLAASSALARWPQLQIARAALLAQCGRREDAVAAYRDALALEPAEPVRRHITGQIAALGAAPAPTEET